MLRKQTIFIVIQELARVELQQLSDYRTVGVVWSALNGNHYHPYHFHRVQALNPEYYERRVQFSECYLSKEL